MANNRKERMESSDQEHLSWRTGEPEGRALYQESSRRGGRREEFLGLMETEEMAVHVVSLHNRVARNDF